MLLTPYSCMSGLTRISSNNPPINKICMRISNPIVAACLALVSITGSSSAASYAWLTSTSGDWSNSAMWSAGGPPTAADAATFESFSAPYTVSFSEDSYATDITARYIPVNLDLSGYSLTTTGLTQAANGATLNIYGGAFSALAFFSGYSTSDNSLTINTGNAMNTVNGAFYVGITDTGTNNSITVQGGTQINNLQYIRIGTQGGGGNAINVSGTGTSLTGWGEFIIGSNSPGLSGDNNIVRVQDGGSIAYSGDILRIGGTIDGVSSGNTLLITGSGSQFTIDSTSGFTTISGNNNNSLRVENGGSFVTNRALAVGSSGTGNSIVVDGGSITATGGTYIADTLRIENGGSYITSTSQFIDFDVEATGKVIFNSGSLLLSSSVNFKGGNALTVGDGLDDAATLFLNNVTGGTAIFSGGIELALNGILAGGGTTASSVKTLASTSTFSPGVNSISTLTVGAMDLTAGGRFIFDLGAGGASDRLIAGHVDATGILAGAFLVELNLSDDAEAGTYTLLSFENQTNLLASQFSLAESIIGYNVDFQLNGNQLDAVLTAIPEPRTAALFMLAGLGLLFRHRMARAA